MARMVGRRVVLSLLVLGLGCKGALAFMQNGNLISVTRQQQRHSQSSCSSWQAKSLTAYPSATELVGCRSKRRVQQLRMRNELNDDDKRKAKMRLREEAEFPFRKVRLFFYYGFIGSAGVGALVSFFRLLALTQGISNGQDVEELVRNIGIDVAAIAVSAFLISRDVRAQANRLERMEIGAKLASLRVRLQRESDTATIPLSGLRRDRGREKRVAIIVGGEKVMEESLNSAMPFSDELDRSDIIIVPVIVERVSERVVARGSESDSELAVGQKHVALPVILNQWQEYVDVEVATALSQGIDPVDTGFALILKKNGRIGSRSTGVPPWDVLCGDVKKRKEAGMDVTNI